MGDSVQRVAVAVVEHGGAYLVGTRRPGEVLAGQAEFPGGKCLPDEASADCAVRECREETGLPVVAVSRLYACRHTYAHGTLDLEFWLCRPATDSTAVGGGYEWLSAQALKSLRFPEANRPVIDRLAAGEQSAS
jgi:8-oxo-dGTP diphosphatase